MHCSRMRCRSILLRTVFLSLILSLLATGDLLAQAADATPSTPKVTLPGPPNPFLGSAPEGQATAEVLQIDFNDAIDRGLRNNLGLLLAGDQAQVARGERWRELSDLLPNIGARIQETVETESLAALGFNKLLPLLAPGTN